MSISIHRTKKFEHRPTKAKPFNNLILRELKQHISSKTENILFCI